MTCVLLQLAILSLYCSGPYRLWCYIGQYTKFAPPLSLTENQIDRLYIMRKLFVTTHIVWIGYFYCPREENFVNYLSVFFLTFCFKYKPVCYNIIFRELSNFQKKHLVFIDRIARTTAGWNWSNLFLKHFFVENRFLVSSNCYRSFQYWW